MKTAKNVLSLSSDDAISFFLKSQQYHNLELPEYFVFDDVLNFVRGSVGDASLKDCLRKNVSPEDLDGVNIDILLNKDGHYAVRPIVLANPYLYYFLVRELCGQKSWPVVKDLFDKFSVPGLSSCALPVVSEEKESFHKSHTILNWWNMMEQRSIELSLEYRYMFVTDITNCYGSINPQSIEWAFNLRGTKYERELNQDIAHNIQWILRALQQGRNIGIPQGSSIFDFVAEIVLGYSDLLLHEAIQRAGITASYQIIRYRDDYRIFCNDKDQMEKISYILQQVLESLNFRMNSQKTKISENVVTDSIKSDKLAYIYNTPIFNKKGVDFDSFEKHLLYILMFARKHPNSGQVKTLLSDIDKRMEKHLKPVVREYEVVKVLFDDVSKTDGPAEGDKEIETYVRRLSGGSVRAMVAVAVQIALENVSVCNYALRVISRMIDSLEDSEEKVSLMERVYDKISNTPNSTYNQLWLQNMTYVYDRRCGNVDRYDIGLCKLVMHGQIPRLWNVDWLKEKFTTRLPLHRVVDKEVLARVTPIITFREQSSYYDVSDYTPED